MAPVSPQVQQIIMKAQALLKAGRAKEALVFLEAQAAVPGAKEHCLRMTLQILLKLGQYDACQGLFEQLIALRPDEAHYYNELATFKGHLGDHMGAITVYQRFLKKAPTSADTHFNLARAQKNAGQFDAALASYQTALSHNISQPEEVWLNMAVIQSDHLLQPDRAKEALQTALRLNSRYVPALFNLGNLFEEMGDKEQARTQYEAILEIDPTYVEALARLTNVSEIKTPDDALIQKLEQAARQASTPIESRSSLYFSLGKALDSLKAYEGAFDAYEKANKLARQAGSTYNRDKQAAYTDLLMATFTADWFQNITPLSDASPVFICGMFRSGSTLTEQVLAAHPDVAAGGELEFFPRLVAQTLRPFPQAVTSARTDDLARHAAAYQDSLAALFPGAKMVTDKRPDNFLYLGLIKTLFPKARIIHTTRHALDNCLSVYFLQLANSMGYASDLLDIGHFYAEQCRLMAHWKSLFGEDIFEFSYDDFIANPEGQLKDLLAFCDLAWDDRCLDFHKQDNMVKTASYWQVRQPLYTASSGRWRNYESQIAPLRACLQERGIAL